MATVCSGPLGLLPPLAARPASPGPAMPPSEGTFRAEGAPAAVRGALGGPGGPGAGGAARASPPPPPLVGAAASHSSASLGAAPAAAPRAPESAGADGGCATAGAAAAAAPGAPACGGFGPGPTAAQPQPRAGGAAAPAAPLLPPPPARQHRSTTALDELAARFGRLSSGDAASLGGLSDGGAHPSPRGARRGGGGGGSGAPTPAAAVPPRGAPRAASSPGASGPPRPGSPFDAALGVLPPLPLTLQLQLPAAPAAPAPPPHGPHALSGRGAPPPFDFAALVAALGAPAVSATGGPGEPRAPCGSAQPSPAAARTRGRAGGAAASPASSPGAPLVARKALLSPSRAAAPDPYCKPFNHLNKASGRRRLTAAGAERGRRAAEGGQTRALWRAASGSGRALGPLLLTPLLPPHVPRPATPRPPDGAVQQLVLERDVPLRDQVPGGRAGSSRGACSGHVVPARATPVRPPLEAAPTRARARPPPMRSRGLPSKPTRPAPPWPHTTPQFAHGALELRPATRPARSGSGKADLCRTFAVTGACPYGARCRFQHGGGDGSDAASAAGTPLASPAALGTPSRAARCLAASPGDAANNFAAGGGSAAAAHALLLGGGGPFGAESPGGGFDAAAAAAAAAVLGGFGGLHGGFFYPSHLLGGGGGQLGSPPNAGAYRDQRGHLPPGAAFSPAAGLLPPGPPLPGASAGGLEGLLAALSGGGAVAALGLGPAELALLLGGAPAGSAVTVGGQQHASKALRVACRCLADVRRCRQPAWGRVLGGARPHPCRALTPPLARRLPPLLAPPSPPRCLRARFRPGRPPPCRRPTCRAPARPRACSTARAARAARCSALAPAPTR
jgi:hypothetical protein